MSPGRLDDASSPRNRGALTITIAAVNLPSVSTLRILTVLGARPQFIKSAPVSRAVAEHDRRRPGTIAEILVHTGQHYDRDMSDVFFEELGLRPPDFHLGVGSGSHGAQTGRMLERIEEVMRTQAPDLVLVYGDTNSTLAGALAAAKLGLRVAHVEAGLRSYRRSMPEEINRVVTDHLATWLFAPTSHSVTTLAREGITSGVYLVGDVMYDAALQHLDIARARARALHALGLAPRSYNLVTIHRAENTDDAGRLRSLVAGLQAIAREAPVVWPVHPRARAALAAIGIDRIEGVQTLPPAGYLDMLQLCANARVVLTDSGGVQREAFFFGTPCLTLRDETEWTETVETGWNTLIGVDRERMVTAVAAAAPGQETTGLFGEGSAATRIVEILTNAQSSRRTGARASDHLPSAP